MIEERRQRLLNGQALKMIKAIKKISNEEMKLRDMVKELYPKAEPQYPVFGYALDVALIDKKIAIEYDGYYHYEDLSIRKEKDYYIFRRERIKNQGWKFYRVTMFDKFPNLEQVKENINKILTNN